MRDGRPVPAIGDLLDLVVHPRHGMLRSVYEIARQKDCPDLFVANAEFANARRLRCPPSPKISAFPTTSSGAATTREGAVWSAVGEAVERYCGAIYCADALTTATARELGGDAIPLDRMILFESTQYTEPGFPYVAPDLDAPRAWALAASLSDGRPAYVPAQLVWLGYDLVHPNDYLAQSMSTGLGAGDSLDRAILTGLCEVLERDAFTCHWMAGRPGVRIEPQAAAALCRSPEVARLCGSRYGTLHLSLMQNEFSVPVVSGVVEDRHTGALAVGAACHVDLAVAVEKAAVEAWHTRAFALELEVQPRNRGTLSPVDVTSLEQHILYYRDPAHREEARSLLDGFPDRLPVREPFDGDYAGAVSRIASRLSDAGYEAFAVDVTTPDVADLGMSVARVVVPGLQPLYVGSKARSLVRTRIDRYAARWGMAADYPLNASPHPFP